MDTISHLFSAAEQNQFSKWVADFGQVNLDASDPKGVSDRMTITLNFTGAGSKQPTESEKKAMLEFAQKMYQKLAR